MTGTVRNRHLLLPVTFRFLHQPDITLDFVVDTGFTGSLTLPPAAVAAMGLPLYTVREVNLADDSRVEVAVHVATIVWDRVERMVFILATGTRPLLGTELLDGNELVAQFAEGGLVTVKTL
jgi:clan AA aspartic protease